ncbi:MAG: sialate O-acetylesterase [Opitutaceae bacterium]
MRLFSLLLAVLPFADALALELPHIFGDHMVLQAELPVPVWGTAEAGETVTVEFSGQRSSTTADAAGRWRVDLAPLPASAEPRDLVVSSPNRKSETQNRKFTDVLVGEVWLCSGQSNMDKPLGEKKGQQPVFNAEEEIRTATFPQIRLFVVKRVKSNTPASDVDGTWVMCSPETIDATKFSAAGYFFGRRLHQELKQPVGLVHSCWGGTRIEPWTAPEGFRAVPALAAYTDACTRPGEQIEGTTPAELYNPMIRPLAPFALRGALWYQGESNIIGVDDGARYCDKMLALVRGWRAVWGRELSFYFVQVAPHLYHVVRPGTVVSPECTPRLWEAQAAAARLLPRSGMIVTTDLVDDLFDIHPRNKKDVGERLARLALAGDYGRTDLATSGPVFDHMEIAGARAILHFTHATGLRASDDKPLTWFTVAGADGVFWPAIATIESESIAVSSPRVAAPVVVRFAWDEAARPNLTNAAGLPAQPFRTDDSFRTTRP